VELAEQFVVAPRSGRAFEVHAGQLLRFALTEGSQVVDFNAFNLDNFREMFSSSVTRAAEGVHLAQGNRLLSVPPWERTMFTILADTVRPTRDERGARSHDLLFGRCTRKIRVARYGSDTPGCQENIAAAIATRGLGEEYVHDPFNIFMKTGIDALGRLFFVDPDAVAGDYLELRAEMDCLVAISTCPGRSSGPVPHSVSVELYGR
jgi:uncharacterized protein